VLSVYRCAENVARCKTSRIFKGARPAIDVRRGRLHDLYVLCAPLHCRRSTLSAARTRVAARRLFRRAFDFGAAHCGCDESC